jgi:hypothetical protein
MQPKTTKDELSYNELLISTNSIFEKITLREIIPVEYLKELYGVEELKDLSEKQSFKLFNSFIRKQPVMPELTFYNIDSKYTVNEYKKAVVYILDSYIEFRNSITTDYFVETSEHINGYYELVKNAINNYDLKECQYLYEYLKFKANPIIRGIDHILYESLDKIIYSFNKDYMEIYANKNLSSLILIVASLYKHMGEKCDFLSDNVYDILYNNK